MDGYDSSLNLYGLPSFQLRYGVIFEGVLHHPPEVAPLKLRNLLTAYINMCWSIGRRMATAVLTGMASNPTEWSYRIPFALQWLWPALIFSFVYWAPESPYWLVRHGKLNGPEAALRQLVSSRADRVDVRNMLALTQRTNERGQEMASAVRYVD